jgi:hypothetical protein
MTICFATNPTYWRTRDYSSLVVEAHRPNASGWGVFGKEGVREALVSRQGL